MSDLMYRLALRTWPADYRREHGDELIDTAREMRNGNFSAAEAWSLAVNGVGVRHLSATDGKRQVTWDGAARIAVLLTLGQVLAEVLSAWVGEWPAYMADSWGELLLRTLTLSGIGIAFLLFVRARLMAVVFSALCLAAWFWGPTAMPRLELAAYCVAVLVPAWWMARQNRKAGLRPVLALCTWVGCVVSVAAVAGRFLTVHDVFFVTHDLLVLAVGIAGIMFAKRDPRIAAGVGLFWVMRLVIAVPSYLDAYGWGTLGSRPGLQAMLFCSAAITCLVAGHGGATRAELHHHS